MNPCDLLSVEARCIDITSSDIYTACIDITGYTQGITDTLCISDTLVNPIFPPSREINLQMPGVG